MLFRHMISGPKNLSCIKALFYRGLTILNLLVVVIVFTSPCSAKTKSPFVDLQYHIQHILEEDGLPHIDVYDAIEDSTGFIWMATLSGICRYDGYAVHTILEKKSDADRVRTKSLILDNRNNLWIGSEKGIKYLDTYSEEYIAVDIHNSLPAGLEDEQVELEYYDSRGYLWAKINNELFYFRTQDNKILSAQAIADIAPDGFTAFYHAVIEDRNNNIWIGTHKGLLQLVYTQDEFEFESFINLESEPFHLSHGSAISLYIDQNGYLIVGSIEGLHIIQLTGNFMDGISQVRQIDFLSVTDQPIIGSADAVSLMHAAVVNSVVQDDFGDYWLGTDVGLLKLEMAPDLYQSRFVLIRAAMNSNTHLSSNIINNTYLTRNGTLILCTFGGGVDIVDTHQKRINYLYADHNVNALNLNENHIRAVAEDKKGNIWIGYQSSGISYIDLVKKQKQNYQFQIVDIRNNRNNIRALYLEDERYLWIGTLKELLCFDVETRKLVNLPQNLLDSTFRENGYITNIKVDSYNNLWISNWVGGVLHCKRDKDKTFEFTSIKRYSTSSEVKILNDLCNYILPVSNMRSVLVSSRTGIEKFQLDADGNIIDIIHYSQNSNTPQKLTSDFVWDIVEMNPALFYAGTIEGGLNRIELTDSLDVNGLGIYYAESINRPAHFQIENVECLLKDKYNNLWLAGKSLFYYDTRKGVIEPYDFSISTFGNSFKVGSSYSGRSGNLYFGGTKGLCYFNPDNIRPKTKAPITVITMLEIHNQSILPHVAYDGKVLLNKAIYNTRSIQLNHMQNNFTIYFSSLQYDNPQSIRYKYRMVGVDKDWVLTTGDKQFVTYTNLKSRNHRFEVMSSNIDGVWGDSSCSLKVRIQPPWYLSISLIIVYVFIFLSAIVYLYYYQWRFLKLKNTLDIQRIEEKKKEELYNEKFIFFTNVSHELRTPLTLISVCP